MSAVVRLTWGELNHASYVGLQRQLSAIQRGAKDRNGHVRHPYDGHVEGACAECATAKWMGVFWQAAINAPGSHDVGPLEVRMRPRDGWDLILRPKDRDLDIFVLVTGGLGVYRLKGWIRAVDGKLPKYLKDPTGGNRDDAYFVPQSELRPLAELPPFPANDNFEIARSAA